MRSQVVETRTADETRAHGEKMSKNLPLGPFLILLIGDLGVGKTEWVKGFARGFLGSETVITSPTFSVINAYSIGKKKLYHADLYRLSGGDDLESVGFWDLLTGKNVVIAEWGDKLPVQWSKDVTVVKIVFEISGETSRKLFVESAGFLKGK